MILGIVGSEWAKFTPYTETRARVAIQAAIKRYGADEVVSGACHLGGIDEWAIEEALEVGIGTRNFPPAQRSWEGGYKPRNIQIAQAADAVVCITLRELPDTYRGMTFKLCYHCGVDTHVKSGGCWTMKYAQKIGKKGELIVI